MTWRAWGGEWGSGTMVLEGREGWGAVWCGGGGESLRDAEQREGLHTPEYTPM